MSGYSSTPLAKKLGIKPGYKIKLVNAPEHYFYLFADMPADIEIATEGKQKKDFIHFFTKDAGELHKALPQLKKEITQDGIIWVSWPKKSAKIPSDVTENDIRDLALRIGLVDIKVCAVDEIWSGLKLVIPVKDRKKEG
jgi:hypothetical protein